MRIHDAEAAPLFERVLRFLGDAFVEVINVGPVGRRKPVIDQRSLRIHVWHKWTFLERIYPAEDKISYILDPRLAQITPKKRIAFDMSARGNRGAVSPQKQIRIVKLPVEPRDPLSAPINIFIAANMVREARRVMSE